MSTDDDFCGPGCSACLPWGQHPIFQAIRAGNTERVISLLQEDITLLREVDNSKRRKTPFHTAAEHGNLDVLKALVRAVMNSEPAIARLSSGVRLMLGLDEPPNVLLKDVLHQRCKGGLTPLTVAAMEGHGPAVAYLRSVGSQPWLGDESGMTALHHAAARGKVACMHELLRDPPPYYNRAPRFNNHNTKYVDVLDDFAYTALHHAALNKRSEAVALLLSYDANIIARSGQVHPEHPHLPSGATALHIAAWDGNAGLVKLILKSYYESSADLLPSQTALLASSERRRRQRSHPDPRLILTRTARLPYHLASRNSHTALLEYLDPSVPLMFLFSGTDEDVGPNGQTVLMVGVPRLTVLAANALHDMLMSNLEVAGQHLEEHKKLREAKKAAKAAEAAEAAKPKVGTAWAGKRDATGLQTLNESGSVPGSPMSPAKVASRLVDSLRGTNRKLREGSKDQSYTGSRRPSTAHATSPLRGRSSLNSTFFQRVRQTISRGSETAAPDEVTPVDLLRMGISIPQDLERDHTASLSPGMAQPLDLSLRPSQPLMISRGPASGVIVTAVSTSLSDFGQAEEGEGGVDGSRPGHQQTSLVLHSPFYLTAARGDRDDSPMSAGSHAGSTCTPHGASQEEGDAPTGQAGEQSVPSEAIRSSKPHQAQVEQLRVVSVADSDSNLSTASMLAYAASFQAANGNLVSASSTDTNHPSTTSPCAPLPNAISSPAHSGQLPDTANPGSSTHPSSAAALAAARPSILGPPGRHQEADVNADPGSSPHSGGTAASGPSNAARGLKSRLRPATNHIVPFQSKPSRLSTVAAGKSEGQSSTAEPAKNGDVLERGAKPDGDGSDDSEDGAGVDEDDVCPVCLDEIPVIKLMKCNHLLCITCAKDLCQRHRLTPALCPYCRTIISGLQAAPRGKL